MEQPYRFTVVAHAQEIIDNVSTVAMDDPEVALSSCSSNADILIQMARQQLEQGQEAVLCHGGTGHAIVNAIGPSAVAISRTVMDVIKALEKAKAYSRNIGIATHTEEYLDIEALQQLLNVRLFPINYTTWNEQRAKVDALYASDVRVLVGGGISAQRMTTLGGVGIVLPPNVHSIHEAMQRAKAIARQKRADKRHLDELQAVFEHLKDGVVCVDSSCSLLFVNKIAKHILNLEDNSPESLWAQVFERLLLKDVLGDLERRREEIISFKNRQLVVSAAPLLVHAGLSGAVAVFSDVSAVQKIHRKISENRFGKSLFSRYAVRDIKGGTPEMARLREHIRRFAATDAAVHITGETGTGKERVAHAVHAASKRQKAPFVAVNISALPEALIESELFGYEEGAFTGARRGGKPGLLEIAHGGTLFLDEIGDLSLLLQLRLLRVLESKEVMRVGASGFVPVDVRIVSATHHTLMDLVQRGSFRMDLFFRLTTLTLTVPPLRDRVADIPLLAQEILTRHGFAKDHLSGLMVKRLAAYSWPGNVRELLALLERYCVLNDGRGADEALLAAVLADQQKLVTPGGTPPACREPEDRAEQGGYSLKQELDRVRSEIIRKCVAHCDGDRRRAAKELGMSHTTLWRELREEKDPRKRGT